MSRQRNGPRGSALSRREFARGAALAAATTVLPRRASAEEAAAAASTANTQAAALSPGGEAQLQAILAKYGKRFSEEQKADLRRLIAQAQKTGETLHSLSLDNSDEPAMIFRIYRPDRR